MDEIIVYAPKDSSTDYDYIAFSFNGKHSYEDLHIIRTSDGDRYNENLFPTLKDTAVEVPNGDGMYFLKTDKGPREFVINFAFDDLDDDKIEQLKETFDTTKVGPLWFAEYPFKVYEAKVKTPVVLKYLCFDENGVNKYKGEGTVNFICYQPYARTPDYVSWGWDESEQTYLGLEDGRLLNSYGGFKNQELWEKISNLPLELNPKNNCGQIPAPFIVTKNKMEAGEKIQIGDCWFETINTVENVQWDSKTGVVIANGSPIRVNGKTIGKIPTGNFDTLVQGNYNEDYTLTYHYWYY